MRVDKVVVYFTLTFGRGGGSQVREWNWEMGTLSIPSIHYLLSPIAFSLKTSFVTHVIFVYVE